MRKELANRITFLTFSFLILYASMQFILILRHKSPYTSDSYFYKHMFYQFKNYSFDDSKKLITSQVDYEKSDEIEFNIFLNGDAYLNSYQFFEKRPLYPVLAFFSSKVFISDYLSFMIPSFVSYVSLISLAFFIFKKRLKLLLASVASFLFISFYPMLDWSTYFATDTLGAFFWMTQIVAIYKFMRTENHLWLMILALLVILSLLNREQSLVLVLVPVLTFFFLLNSKYKKLKKLCTKVFLALVGILVAYVLLAKLTGSKNILDTIAYTMNSYGYTDNSFTRADTFSYLLSSYKQSHLHLVRDITSHHVWFIVLLGSAFGAIISLKRRNLLDLLMISSAVASYSAFFLYPVLSYRYFFPVVISACYFAAIFLERFEILATKKR